MLEFDPHHVEELAQHLSPEEQAELRELAERRVGGESFDAYIRRTCPSEPPPRHLRPLIQAIDRARLVPLRACYSLPPGHAKTTTLMRSVPWWLESAPADLCAYVTYSDSQARDKSSIARDLAEQEQIELRQDADSLSSWKLPHGGGLIAAGARGKLTGQRVPGLLIYDDPYKDGIEARSPAIRKQVSTRFRQVAFTRLKGGSAIVTHTRYATDDLIGELVKLGWPLINIPAIAEEGVPDPLGRQPGEAAWPEQYPVEKCPGPCGHAGHLQEIRETIGEYEFAALYQGRPRPIGGKVFEAEPLRFDLRDFKWEGKRGVISCDPAATEQTAGDYSAIQVWAMEGYGTASKAYLVWAWRGQVSIPTLCSRLRDVQAQFRLLIAVEAVAGFKSVPQILRDADPTLRIVEITGGGAMRTPAGLVLPVARGDKFTRAQPLAAAWNGTPAEFGRPATPQRVYVPIGEPWVNEFLSEVQDFTGVGDAHDDQVDAAAHGWNALYRSTPPAARRGAEEAPDF